MKPYRKILVALELNEPSDKKIIARAQELATKDTELYLLHAVEHMSSYGAAYGISAGIDVEEVLLTESRKALGKLATKFDIPVDHQMVRVGPAKFIILEEAEQHHCDLIVLGSHGRHGVQLLLGSTCNAVLHGAKSDVLAVRV